MSKKAKKGSEDSKKQLEKSIEVINPKREVNDSEERDQSQNASFNKNDTSVLENNLNKSNTKPSKSAGSKKALRESQDGNEEEEGDGRFENNPDNEDVHDEEEAQEYAQYEKDYQEIESKNQSMISKKNKEMPWMAYDFLFPAGILAKLVGLNRYIFSFSTNINYYGFSFEKERTRNYPD